MLDDLLEDKAAAVNEIAKQHAGVQGQASIDFEGMVADRADPVEALKAD